ncbi:CD276 antigen homolog [Danio aesculapii]|uniref:CD276 antigen homolog n=1 Tax=Danio aesculapii TaxID=1142201 RepID=UPI0024C04A96|nr:CD276 antigen homolog [Danio aesculapii]
MYTRCCFIYMLIPLLDTASLHQIVEGTEGDSIILPCTHRRLAHEGKRLTVHWRHNDTRNVYDIIHGRNSVKEQHPAYNDRAEVLHKRLEKGHIELKLTNLHLSDTGTYLCFVPDARVEDSTQLLVRERQSPKYAAVQLRSHGTGTTQGRTLHIIIPLSGLIHSFFFFSAYSLY